MIRRPPSAVSRAGREDLAGPTRPVRSAPPATPAQAGVVAERRRVSVSGVVQGVGFRPFVHRLATGLGLSGWVRNDGAGVEIEVQGPADRLDLLCAALVSDAPPLAVVDGVVQAPRRSARESGFEIRDSVECEVRTRIGHDAATCPECLAELFDPADRRYRYAFTNCTACGPRYTIVERLPYDRPNTTMAGFAMCPRCALEYASPDDRRFHAEPNACPNCGPRLRFVRGGRAPEIPGDPIARAWASLRAGEIVAVKGLGGFHLACDARNASAVGRLRRAKQRDEKPFAVMVANLPSARRYADVTPEGGALLASSERPIVLLDKRPGCDDALAGVAPGVDELGVVLPYTPLHYLLFHEARGCPDGTAWLGDAHETVLVMTSANPGGEPITVDDDTALETLGDIVDAFLVHDRTISTACEDSVVRPRAAATPTGGRDAAPGLFVRRGRGYAPHAIRLARGGPPVLAVGSIYKNTIALTRADQAFLSPHIGDLDSAAACAALERAVRRLQDLVGVRPLRIAHDLHPDSPATRLAERLAGEHGIPLVGVQHHHAHLAAVLAEHGIESPALGLALDGIGLGADGRPWGGELLRVDGATFARLGHLRALPLPGGDRAAREPWRMAAAALHALDRGAEIADRFPGRAGASTVATMLARGFRCPPSTSMGRWFDAVAGLLGACQVAGFEGQAPMLLEARARSHGPVPPWEEGFRIGKDGVLDLLPLLERLATERDVGRGAALFHATVGFALAEWVDRAAASTGLSTVALGGGCFLNRLLSRDVAERLVERGYRVLSATRVPPSDGGLSLGQAWVALHADH